MSPHRKIQWSFTANLDLDFADDASLLSYRFKPIQQKTSALYKTTKPTGLEINTNKTKPLGINTQKTADSMVHGNLKTLASLLTLAYRF